MTIPKYLETFRRAAREAQRYDEKNELNEKRGKGGELNSSNSFISCPKPSQNSAEPDTAACAVCNAPGDLWHFGEVLVHQECAAFLPEPEPGEPTAAYQAASPECSVTVIELPQVQRYRKTLAALQTKPPALVDVDRWRQCVEDGKRFLAKWGEQAESLGWTSADLFGLHIPPEQPHPSYSRLSRYDCTGLVWLLRGREVVALTEATATIRNSVSGNVTTYRCFNKPSLGPVAIDLDDFEEMLKNRD
jgi:hypothetical protein